MTMAFRLKRCPKCHKRYEWNPDVGKVQCPYCKGLTQLSRIINKFGIKKGW